MLKKISKISLVACIVLAGCAPMQVKQSREMYLNGIRLTEVTAFPETAWGGLPMIQSTSDLNNMAKIASLMANTSVTAANKGNADLAVASWFWYRQYASRTLSVMDNSLKAISAMDGTSAGTVIPGNSLVILPAFDRYQKPANMAEITHSDLVIQKGVMLAGGGDAALSDAIRQIVQSGQQPVNPAQRQAVANLPLNTPVRMDNGLYLERREKDLVIFNQNPADTTVPLREINYIPAMPIPSETRKNAAPFITSMRDAVYQTLIQKNQAGMSGEVNVIAPNLVKIGSGSMGHTLNGDGQITKDPKESDKGQKAYRGNPAYKLSVDFLAKIPRDPAVSDFNTRCFAKNYGYIYEFSGVYAEILRTSCASGTSPIYSRDFYVSGDAAIQKYESILADQRIVQNMKNMVASGDAVDNALSFVPVAGNIENALQCAGVTSAAEFSSVFVLSGRKGQPGMLHGAAVADMAGWKPEAASLTDTAVNCAAAIPVLGNVGSGVKLAGKGAKALNKTELAAKADKYGAMLEIFKTPGNMSEGATKVAALFPNNKDLAAMLHKGYNIFQHSLNTVQTVQGFSQLSAAYAKGDLLP